MPRSIRVAITLEDDVAALLKRLCRDSKTSLKELVNRALREGLPHVAETPAKRKRFDTTAVDLGRCFLPNLDCIAEVLAFCEGEDFR